MIKVKILKPTVVTNQGSVEAGKTIEVERDDAVTLINLKYAELVSKADEKEIKTVIKEPVDFEKEEKTATVEKKIEETPKVETKKNVAKKEVKKGE